MEDIGMKVCLVGSSGGQPFWESKERFWVSFDKEDANSLLKGERMYACYYPTNRNLKNLIRNTILAWKVLKNDKITVLQVNR